jgi:enoyl-CoA hydratase/carnithine racemase
MGQGWQEILYKVEDRVATITLNRPEKLTPGR